jgi:hypothetical protein
MEALHGLAPTSDALERLLELREVLHLDHQVEFAEARRAKPQLAPRHAPALYQPLFLQMAHISGNLVREASVGDAGLQVAPGMIDIQLALLQPFVPAAITAAIGTAIPSAVR